MSNIKLFFIYFDQKAKQNSLLDFFDKAFALRTIHQIYHPLCVRQNYIPCDRKRVQPGTLVHVPGEVGHVMKTILC